MTYSLCKSVDGSLTQLGGRKTQAHAASFPPSPAQVGRIHSGPDWALEPAWGKAVSLELGKRVRGQGGVDVHSVLHPLKRVRPDMALEPHNLPTKYLPITKAEVTSQGRYRQTPP